VFDFNCNSCNFLVEYESVSVVNIAVKCVHSRLLFMFDELRVMSVLLYYKYDGYDTSEIKFL